jgi:hypothetical protein
MHGETVKFESEFSFSRISNVLKYCLITYTQINYRLRMNENRVRRIICGLKKKQWENGRNYVRSHEVYQDKGKVSQVLRQAHA